MKLLELIGIPVYEMETGKQVSQIKDFCITEQWWITHLELERRHHPANVIPVVRWEDVTACGEDAIMIANDKAIQQIEAGHIGRSFLEGQAAMKGLPVVTTEGMQLGWVADVYFQPNKGNQVTGLEITDGLLSDLLEGRRQIDGVCNLMWGADAIIVADEH